MRPSEDLFELIQRMDKSEKRYFKVFAKSNKIQSNYIRLFDAINKQSVYDEEPIKKKFRGEKFVKQLSVTKNKLYKVILKSLATYHAGNSLSNQVGDILKEVSVLFRKKLFRQCRKLLDKCEKIVDEYELYYIGLEIYRWRTYILLEEGQLHQYIEKLTQLNRQIDNGLQKMLEINHYSFLSAQSNYYSRSLKVNDRKSFERLMENPLLQDEKQATTFDSKKMFYFIQTQYGTYIGDYERNYLYSKKGVQLYEKTTELTQSRSLIYIASLHNFILACKFVEKYDDMRIAVKKMRKINSSEVLIQAKVYLQSWYWELVLHTETFALKEAEMAAKKLAEGLELHEGQINVSLEFAFCLQLISFYFKTNECEKGLDWVARILEHPHKHKSMPMVRQASIFELVIYFELQNDWLLASKARSLYRNLLQQKPSANLFEQSVLNFLRNIYPKVVDERELKSALLQWQSELRELKKQKTLQGHFEAIDWCLWIESKLEGKTYWALQKERSIHL